MAPPERRSTASLETPLEDPSALPPPSEASSEALLALPSSTEAPSTLPLSSETPLKDPATLPSSSETSALTSRCYPELMTFRRHKELVTRDSVLSAFKAIGETESAELDHIVDFVLRKGERVFLILVLMTYNNAEKLSALRELKSAGVDDDKLPLELSNKELLDQMPKGWEDNDFELFWVHQWPLLAPIFERESIYDLHELQPLPYVELPSTPKGEGFFGEVSRAEIHEAHIIEKHRPAENARANNRPNGIAVAIKKAKDPQESKDFFNQEVEGLWKTNELDSPHIIKIIAAYRRGSRHGDLKPENILWFKNDGNGGCLKIADLGLLRFHRLDADTGLRNEGKIPTNTPSGTSRYEPPEMVKDRITKGARARRYDIWSMGCIMTELLTFRLPRNTPYFWHATQDENGETVYYVNPYVSSCLSMMQGKFQANSTYSDLLELIRNKLLVVSISKHTSSEESRADADVMYREMLQIQKEPPFANLPGLPADLKYPDTEIRDQRNKYTRPAYKGGMLSPGNTRSPVRALPSPHNQPIGQVDNLDGDFTPEVVVDPPGDTTGPALPATTRSTVADEREVAESATMNNQDQSARLNDIWESVPDNDFATRLFGVLSWDTIRPRSGCQGKVLCPSCNAINSPRLFRPVVYRYELESSSQDCHLCGILYSALKSHRYESQAEISLYQDGSIVGIKDGPNLLSVYVEPDRRIRQGTQLGLPRLPDAGSQEQFLLLKEWIKVCDTTHSSCCRPNDEANNGSSSFSMPTRLLKLGNPIRLVESGNLPEAGRLCTFKNNIAQLTQGIEFNDLPKTFQDAIQVTGGIGIEYLWIDSLCIIQGDREDWGRESSLMEGVFSSAYCTIAASSSKSSAEGFLNVRQPRLCVQLETASMGKLYVCQNIDNFHRDVGLGELNSRGWVMQERVLSRRSIFYTSTQVYWECGAGVHCETLARLKNAKAALVGDARFPNSALEYYRDGRQILIQDLYEGYSRLAFTDYWDRPVAILGLQERLARALGTRGAYGVFAEYFARLLLWKRCNDGPMKRLSQLPESKWLLGAHHDAPTWSWFSKVGAIKYITLEFQTIQWERADFKNPFESSENQSRCIKTFRAKVRKISLSQDEVPRYIILDEDQDVVVNDLRCVVIGRGRFRDSTPGVRDHVLIIRNVVGSDRYERIGVASLNLEPVAGEGSWVTIE
ncbi:hypothetical protein F5X98DRAFT_383183 [Xylaria grammica]|nr:hypothetical protein F5X98DRAFT_383183 [Xylaria grammica]